MQLEEKIKKGCQFAFGNDIGFYVPVDGDVISSIEGKTDVKWISLGINFYNPTPAYFPKSDISYFYEEHGNFLVGSDKQNYGVYVNFTQGSGIFNWPKLKKHLISKKPEYGKCLSEFGISLGWSAAELESANWLLGTYQYIEKTANGNFLFDCQVGNRKTLYEFWLDQADDDIAKGKKSVLNLWLPHGKRLKEYFD